MLSYIAAAGVLAGLAFAAYELRLRARAKQASAPVADGFIALAPLATTLGSAALSAILGGVGTAAKASADMTGTIVAAAIGAAPGMFRAIGSSPLWAFLFGAILFGLAGMGAGSHIRKGVDEDRIAAAILKEAPRVKIKNDIRKDLAAFTAHVVATANERADKAIAEAIKNANARADKAIAGAKTSCPAPAAATKKAR